jgi:hypothetical protein
MKILPVESELLYVDGRTDGRTDRQTDRHDEANSKFFAILRYPQQVHNNFSNIVQSVTSGLYKYR